MLTRLHLAIKTRNIRHAGTASHPVLILGEGSNDRLHHTFETAEGLQAGQTFYQTLDVSGMDLSPYVQYIRLGIRGGDAWWPEFMFLWGDMHPGPEPVPGIQVYPMALRTKNPNVLSTDESEGRISLPLSQAMLGNVYNLFTRFLIMIRTGDVWYAGAQDPITLSVHTAQGVMLEVALSGAQLGAGQVYLDAPYAPAPFNVNSIRSIELRASGADSWLPEQVFILAIAEEHEDHKQLYPMVYLQDWQAAGLPAMSTDPEKGAERVVLYQMYI
ncbi:MAG: hypothetical protein NW241_13350 [Bacteroidia bacterium]|nr:hypothetical protein [Bacteroidia bacterium]